MNQDSKHISLLPLPAPKGKLELTFTYLMVQTQNKSRKKKKKLEGEYVYLLFRNYKWFLKRNADTLVLPILKTIIISTQSKPKTKIKGLFNL